MIYLKTEEEIELLRENNLLVSATLAEVGRHIKPGITTRELDAIAEEFIRSHGAVPAFLGYSGYPATLCISVNEQIVHGIPSDYALKEGDIVSVDCGTFMKGFVGDSAYTFAVGEIVAPDRSLTDDAKLVQGIYRIQVSGATPMEWRLEYDNNQLTELGITVADIQSAISTYYNKEFLGIADISNNDPDRKWMRLALIPDVSEQGFDPQKISVKGKDGKLVRLDQVLKVTRQEEEPQSYYRINGLNSIYLSIWAEETANQLQVAKKVKEEIQHIEEILPAGYEIHTSYDATEYIQEELDKIYVRTGLTILILLVFVLLITWNVRYLFLIVISLSINLCIAVIFYYLLGLEMQLYSLAGITISLSLVIDNTIVMTDHIRRRHNLKAFLSILAATLTTMGALVIVFFLDENIRLNLQDFAAVVIINLAVSLAIALFLVPALIDKMGLGRAKMVEKKSFWVFLRYIP